MTSLIHTWTLAPDEWILSLRLFPEILGGSFVSSTSSGRLRLYSTEFSNAPLIDIKAHESSINDIEKIDENTLVSASTDGVKVWDLRQALQRPQLTLSNPKKSNFLSLGSKGLALAGGTELVGVDAELHIWDLKNPDSVVRSFVDSHHDDITDIKFHPSYNYLMSGSTDGCVNIYNLDEPDEDEALHQVVNFASVHSCHFTGKNRISVLSHMETLGFFELNSTDYDVNDEPPPNDLGDVRSLWPNCEYVVDIGRDHVFYGANLRSSLTVIPFDAENETFAVGSAISFPGAHGEEVVRDGILIPNTNKAITCGEDGTIKAWQLPVNVVGESEKINKKEKKEKKEKKVEKKEKREKKEKKEKKDRNDRDGLDTKKRHKEKKKSSRFKPY
ncbi:CIC11C00000000260 [Sungouiella intermedia]|uniref:CIC11C00000000260 n=1 Tax=Sungouiella intermedia TaxID=45354 RepID=A0A1L0BKR7_9ASCO|nr:CIC11C00000000260 [[Candida] intermedia]